MSYGYPQPYQYQPPYGAYPQYQPTQMSQSQQIQRQPPVQQPMTGYSCRPVADESEARAVPTDFSGTTLVMVDQAHGCIYTKALNPMDGSAVFLTYRLDMPTAPKPVEYATREMLMALDNKVEALKKLLEIDDLGGGDT